MKSPRTFLLMHYPDLVPSLETECEMSRYLYVPQQISESRSLYQFPLSSLSQKFEEVQTELQPNEEVAFHSRLHHNGQEFHIPMLDMSCEIIEPHLDDIKQIFQEFGIKRVGIFHSGRSYHLYGLGLLKGRDELIKFIGRALLLNWPGRKRVIDERWVGHRLMAGYLTLRWTARNPHYKKSPEFYLMLS